MRTVGHFSHIRTFQLSDETHLHLSDHLLPLAQMDKIILFRCISKTLRFSKRCYVSLSCVTYSLQTNIGTNKRRLDHKRSRQMLAGTNSSSSEASSLPSILALPHIILHPILGRFVETNTPCVVEMYNLNRSVHFDPKWCKCGQI